MRSLLPALCLAAPLAAQDITAITRELDTYIPRSLAAWQGAGVAVGIVKDDKLVYAKGFGVREVGKPDLVDDQTLFAIGSNTKFFTAVAAGMLADDGKLSLDDKVTKFLPWFQLYDPWVTREFTLRDAMSHRSGLGRRGDPLWYGTGRSRDELIRLVRHLPPNSSFRTEYGYQNLMFITAGQSLAAAAGMSWDDLIARRIFQPLGMSASRTLMSQLRAQSNIASPHDLGPNDSAPRVIPWRDIDNAGPAGSITSNVQDMAKWMRFILANGVWGADTLLKPRTLADITGPHSIPTRVLNDTLRLGRHFSLYALGIGTSDVLGVKLLQHTGGIDGMLSFVGMVPERKLGVVVLTNTGTHNAMYSALGQKILIDLLGGPKYDWSAITLAETRKAEAQAAEQVKKRLDARVANTQPSRPLAEYAGTYRHEMYGDVIVTVEDGALRVRHGNVIDIRLQHFHYDTFNARSSGLLLGETAWVSFALDSGAKVNAISIEGLAEFGRVRGGA
ncbi:MAG: serine hydrolase [Gemmatimonadetes bacterium]|nr:serine hydrolase [Gemmatimonadota bacterium]